MKPFLIISPPRSGTAWLANWLTQGDVYCYHELFGELWVKSAMDVTGTLGDVTGLFRSMGRIIQGNADSGNIMFLEQLKKLLPDVTLVAVTRNVSDVYKSLARAMITAMPFDEVTSDTLQITWGHLVKLDGHLEYVIKEYGLREETFDELFTTSPEVSMAAGRRIWSAISGGQPFDEDRWLRLRRMNVQLTSEAIGEVVSRAPSMAPLLETRDEWCRPVESLQEVQG